VEKHCAGCGAAKLGDYLVHFWAGPWLHGAEPSNQSAKRSFTLLTRVSKLLNPNTGTWDKQLEHTFWREDAAIILNTPTNENVADWLAWDYDSNGIFSVRSAYMLVVQPRDEGFGRNSSTSAVEGGALNFEWFKIWQLPYTK
jgi:hypothetical protein